MATFKTDVARARLPKVTIVLECDSPTTLWWRFSDEEKDRPFDCAQPLGPFPLPVAAEFHLEIIFKKADRDSRVITVQGSARFLHVRNSYLIDFPPESFVISDSAITVSGFHPSTDGYFSIPYWPKLAVLLHFGAGFDKSLQHTWSPGEISWAAQFDVVDAADKVVRHFTIEGWSHSIIHARLMLASEVLDFLVDQITVKDQKLTVPRVVSPETASVSFVTSVTEPREPDVTITVSCRNTAGEKVRGTVWASQPSAGDEALVHFPCGEAKRFSIPSDREFQLTILLRKSDGDEPQRITLQGDSLLS